MAYDFTNATDRISVPSTALATARSYSIWSYREGDGGGSEGRVWQKGTSTGGGGTVSVNTLTTGSGGSAATTYTTASISPGSNRLILVWVLGEVTFGGAVPVAPTLTGNGLTYVQVATRVNDSGASLATQRLTLYRAMGASPSTGAITITHTAQTGGQRSCTWSVVEFSGVDTGGTNGSAAVVQSATNSIPDLTASSLTVTLGAFSSASNATAGGFGEARSPGTDVTPGSGFTQLHDTGSTAGNSRLFSEWKSTNDTTVDATFQGIISSKTGIAVEIKAGSGVSIAPDALYVDSTKMYFQRTWSTGGGVWSITKPSADTWHNIVVTYDGSSSSNDPLIYVDGSSQTVTEETAPTGSIDNSDTSAYLLGNRDAFDRNWNGRLAEFSFWDRVLVAGEVNMLAKAYSPKFIPRNLIVHAPLVRNATFNNGSLTVTGATVIEHPRIIIPATPL